MGNLDKADAKISDGKKVMMFSKSYCPFCKKAKAVFQKYMDENILDPNDYEVWEIENEPDCTAIQEHLGKKIGSKSVPAVFINGNYIGGGDDTVEKDRSGELRKALEATK